jgi:hypothetical protein
MKNRHPIALTVLVSSALLTAHSALAQFMQQGPKLVGTGAYENQRQGSSVSLSADGNTAIVGGDSLSPRGIGDGPEASGPGGAWIWTRSGGVWTQQGTKLGGAGGPLEGFSVSLSADGNTAIVGAPGDVFHTGAAQIWAKNAGVWSQQGVKLVSTGGALQGYSVSLSADGNTAIVGGPKDSGGAWVWTRSGGIWTQQGTTLVGSDAAGSAQQGSSVSLSADGNIAIVGGPLDNGFTGAAWVWTRSGGVWTQQGAKLVGSGASVNSLQGTAVSISGDGKTAIVGSYGAAWVWIRSGNIWTQQGAKLVDAGGASGDGQGVSISADGNTALIGGYSDDGGTGAAWVWTRSGGVWAQQPPKLVGSGAVGSAEQGSSVSISGDGRTAIIGGPADNNSAGAAWVFVFDPNSIPSASMWILMALGVTLALLGIMRIRG